MFWQNLTKSVKSKYPLNLHKADVFLPKLNARFLSIKVHKRLAPRQEIISAPETANQWDDGTSWRQWQWSRFPRKINPLQTPDFLPIISIAQWSVVEDDIIMGKFVSGKGKARFDKFRFYGDFFVRNLDISVELRQYQSLSPRTFFLFLTE